MDRNEIVPLPVNGVLDLHPFKPSDIKHLIPDYLDECLSKEIYNVRIIHGKGKGILRRSVHAILESLDCVESYQTADLDSGSWGATLVTLQSKSLK